MKKLLTAIVISWALLLSGCHSAEDERDVRETRDARDAREIGLPVTLLRQAETFELLSVDPNDTTPPTPDELYRFSIVGRLTVTDRNTRDRLIDSLIGGVRDSNGDMASCFCPHHAIRASSQGRTIELVICFECSQITIYDNGVRQATISVSESPVATFDGILAKAKILRVKGGDCS